MKIDKKTLEMLCSLPDDSLWRVISSIGASQGIDLSGIKASREDMSRIRSAVSHLDDSDISRALEIIDSIKSQGKKG